MRKRKRKGISRTAGMPPGAMVHVGEPRYPDTRITLISFDAESVETRTVADPEKLPLPDGEGRVVWINVEGLEDPKLLSRIARRYGIHALVMEDIMNTEQRPKLETYDLYGFVVLKMLSMDRKGRLDLEQVSIYFSRNIVLTFQERPGDVFDPIRERIHSGSGRVRRSGADYLAYALMDIVVDNYFIILENQGTMLDELEDQVPTRAEADQMKEIYRMRRDLISLRKAIWPLRDLVHVLVREEAPIFDPAVRPYLRDLSDHVAQVLENLETHREMIGALLEIYLSNVSVRTNDVMRVLTVISTIFLPLTFITGLYGMNFEHMPELRHPAAYPIVLGFMTLIAGGMLWFFRRKKWF